MKPFSTPVLSKRTYRELKLLKHIQHENVRPSTPYLRGRSFSSRSSASAMFLFHHWKICMFHISPLLLHLSKLCRYFVTELLGTDLHRLLTSRPLEKQFIQYFLYQILVRTPYPICWNSLKFSSARFEIRALRWSCSSRSRMP